MTASNGLGVAATSLKQGLIWLISNMFYLRSLLKVGISKRGAKAKMGKEVALYCPAEHEQRGNMIKVDSRFNDCLQIQVDNSSTIL